MAIRAFLLLTLFSAAFATPVHMESQTRKSYESYKVYSVLPSDEVQLKLLNNIYTGSAEQFQIDFWLAPRAVGTPIDVMVPPGEQAGFESFLRVAGIKSAVTVENVQKLIDVEDNSIRQEMFKAAKSSNFDFANYHSFDEINGYINSLPGAFPDIASTFKVGTSYESREMIGIKIGKAGTSKKAIWIDAGIHAREWLAPSTALFIINELTSKYATDSKIKQYVDSLDWYILPSANPDGYEYTRSTERMWRKTRSKQKCSILQCCYGVDPNRNFPYHFGGSGTSSNACSDIFRGTSALSEPETKALSEAVLAHKDQIKAYLTLHTYGQWWLVPFGYIDPPVYPPDYNELLKVAQDGAAALKAVHGTTFTVGNSDALLYAAAGASDDWAKGEVGTKFSYTMELRPSNTNPSGFVQPASQIIPTAEETWAGIKVVADRVLAL
jgi:carboxypeptidase A2